MFLAVLAAISVGIGVLVLLGSVAASSVRELTRKDNMRLYKEAAEALVRKTTHVFDKLSDTHQGLADMGKEQFGDLPVGETVVKMTNSLVQEVIGLAELAFLVLFGASVFARAFVSFRVFPSFVSFCPGDVAGLATHSLRSTVLWTPAEWETGQASVGGGGGRVLEFVCF